MRIKKEKRSQRDAIVASLSKTAANEVAARSSLYREATAEREEIMRHKWFLSEQAGYDIGYICAMYDWIARHRSDWRKSWRQKNT